LNYIPVTPDPLLNRLGSLGINRLEKLERIVLTETKIRLLINPTEVDHQRLHQAIETAFKRLQSEESLDSETEADIEVITGLGQSILKREWQRVKLGT
jgi:hypothetical protein